MISNDISDAKRSIKDISIPLLGLFYIGLWMILFVDTPMGFRGFRFDYGEALSFLASFCNDLPMCFRFGLGVFYEFLSFCYSTIFKLFALYPKASRIQEVSSFLVVFSFLYGAFLIILKRSSFPISFVGSLGFIFTPFLLPNLAGLVPYDFAVLFFWGVVTSLVIQRISFKFSLGLTIIGTSLFENTGFALSLSFVYLFVMNYFFQKRYDIKFLLIGCIGLIISLLMVLSVYLIIDYKGTPFWVKSGHNFFYQYEVYGKNNSLLSLLNSIRLMVTLPILALILLVCFLIMKQSFFSVKAIKFTKNFNFSSFSNEVYWQFACILGFLSTLLPGFFLSGFTSEWTRQLLPLSYLAATFVIVFVDQLSINSSLSIKSDN